jgi:hypothetical protein
MLNIDTIMVTYDEFCFVILASLHLFFCKMYSAVSQIGFYCCQWPFEFWKCISFSLAMK